MRNQLLTSEDPDFFNHVAILCEEELQLQEKMAPKNSMPEMTRDIFLEVTWCLINVSSSSNEKVNRSLVSNKNLIERLLRLLSQQKDYLLASHLIWLFLNLLSMPSGEKWLVPHTLLAKYDFLASLNSYFSLQPPITPDVLQLMQALARLKKNMKEKQLEQVAQIYTTILRQNLNQIQQETILLTLNVVLQKHASKDAQLYCYLLQTDISVPQLRCIGNFASSEKSEVITLV